MTTAAELKKHCDERANDCPAVNKAYRRAIIIIMSAWGLLWGYFEFRVYPSVVDAQHEIRELYKLIATEKVASR